VPGLSPIPGIPGTHGSPPNCAFAAGIDATAARTARERTRLPVIAVPSRARIVHKSCPGTLTVFWPSGEHFKVERSKQAPCRATISARPGFIWIIP
jgi:hypothetical protein